MRHSTLRTIIIGFIFLLAAGSVFGQLRSSTEPVEIRGQVRYARGGAPAANVVVRLESLSGGYVGEEQTDNLGKFRFPGLLPIQYFVNIRHFGFMEIQQEVNLVMIPSAYIQLALLPDDSKSADTSPHTTKLVNASVPLEARKEFEKGELALLRDKKIDEGIIHLEKAIRIYPKFIEAQLRLGTAYMDKHDWDKAEQALKRALDIDPKAVNAHFALGAMYLQQKRFDEAARILLQGLEIENRSWQGHFTLGRVYWTRNAAGDLFRASRQVAVTMQLNPDLAEAHLLAGNIWMRVNKRDEALMEFEEYMRLAPKGEFAVQTRETMQKIKMSRGQK
ncbi:MAG: repeat protein [Acidobacteria bacterium]|nr:repeat protein [Acidobacteriota bacterium]